MQIRACMHTHMQDVPLDTLRRCSFPPLASATRGDHLRQQCADPPHACGALFMAPLLNRISNEQRSNANEQRSHEDFPHNATHTCHPCPNSPPSIAHARAHTHTHTQNRLFRRICGTSGSARAAYNVAIACAPKSVAAGMSRQSSDGVHPALHNETTALRYLRYARYALSVLP